MPAKKTEVKAVVKAEARLSFAQALEVVRAGIDAEIEALASDAPRHWSLLIVRKGLKGL